jgi:hypothetical protein
MPGAHHPTAVRRQAVRGMLAGLCSMTVAMELEVEHGRRVPAQNIERWVREDSENGYTESVRQHEAAVRVEAQALQARARIRDRIPARVRAEVHACIKRNPYLYAKELADLVHHATGMHFSDAAMSRVRKKLGANRRRAGRPLGQADPIEQRAHKNLFANNNVHDEQLIFIDETSKNSKDFYRKYGYWFDGENQETNPGMAFHVGPQRTWSTLGVFTVDGMIDWSTTEIKHVDGQRGMDTMGFMMDVARVVLPYVQPYPAARSIVVADNVALHHAWGGMLRHMIESRGGRLVYLPT